jgi:hypothetical protein
MTNLEYGFDSLGGFYALDHDARRASYAYPTSEHATKAKQDDHGTAARMLAAEHEFTCPQEIVERHYVAVCRKIGVNA